MRTIIAGSRSITDEILIGQAMLACPWWKEVTSTICGCAPGVDRIAGALAEEMDLPVRHEPADWALQGTRAGFLRNSRMVRMADALITIWDGVSNGTMDTVDKAYNDNLRVWVYTVVGRGS